MKSDKNEGERDHPANFFFKINERKSLLTSASYSSRKAQGLVFSEEIELQKKYFVQMPKNALIVQCKSFIKKILFAHGMNDDLQLLNGAFRGSNMDGL